MGRKTKTRREDVVVLTGLTQDGEGMHALRSRSDRLEVAEIRPVSEGQPLGAGELVRLRPRTNPVVCDVDVLARIEEKDIEATSRPGRSRVATSSYRRNYDRVFGRRRCVDDASAN